MQILQCGIAKSGNFWLYKILSHILEKANVEEKSFIKSQPIHKIAQSWSLSFPEQVNINYLDITENALFYRMSNIFVYPIDDIDDYIDRCNVVWTHSQFCSKSKEVFPKFNKRIYIIRDPRDVAISWSNFVFTPYKKRHYPFQTVNDTNPQQYLNNHLTQIISDWVNHVGKYLKYQDELGIYFVFYERLLHNFDEELQKILNYLELELKPRDIDDIKNKVDFNTMKPENENHLRKGKTGQWLEILSEEQNQQTLNLAKPLLQILNYPINREETLPQLTQRLPEDFGFNLGKVSLLVTVPH